MPKRKNKNRKNKAAPQMPARLSQTPRSTTKVPPLASNENVEPSQAILEPISPTISGSRAGSLASIWTFMPSKRSSVSSLGPDSLNKPSHEHSEEVDRKGETKIRPVCPPRQRRWKLRPSRWWPCRTVNWFLDVAAAVIRLLRRGAYTRDLIHSFALLALFLFGCWIVLEGILQMVQPVAAQEETGADCSVVYVTIPGPIITVSLIASRPSNPASGTYYYSVVNGSTEWLNSIAPPSRFSTLITKTPTVTSVPPSAQFSSGGLVSSTDSVRFTVSLPSPTVSSGNSTLTVPFASSPGLSGTSRSSPGRPTNTLTGAPNESATSFTLAPPGSPKNSATTIPPVNSSRPPTISSVQPNPNSSPVIPSSLPLSNPGASAPTSSMSPPRSPPACTGQNSDPECSGIETRVLSFGDTAYSFVFPTPDITTTVSYWTGEWPTITGSEPLSIPLTTRTAHLSPMSGLPSFEVFKSSGFLTEVATVAAEPVSKSGDVAATAAEPTGCGEYGNFTLNFDDVSLGGDKSGMLPVKGLLNPYHHLFYANGYTYVPDKWEPYPAISQPNVAMYLPLRGALLPNTAFAGTLLPGEIGAGPRASVDAYWFNAYHAFFGCALNGIEPCKLQISGFRYDSRLKEEVVVAEQNVTIPPCWGYIKCRLTQVKFGAGFRGLSGIQFQAYTYLLGIPQIFMVDSLGLAWYNNTCAAGILRIGHR